jgi:glycosidase
MKTIAHAVFPVICIMMLLSCKAADSSVKDTDQSKGKVVKPAKFDKFKVYPVPDPKHKCAEYKETVPYKDPGSKLKKDWWKTATFIEIFVRSYKDSDGDGKGDFKGLISKLDYLKQLGIGGIWLLPVMESSDNDHGYHTMDYRAVESDYGTMEDFKKLLDEAHKRGIGIIIDFVINHASAKHPMFIEASTNVNGMYRDYFVYTNINPGKWVLMDKSDLWFQFPSGYFYAGFTPEIPDWNFRNPNVHRYMADNIRFWLNMGVDGYRLDAVAHLIENGPNATYDQPESIAYFTEFREIVNHYQNRFTICEDSNPGYMTSDKMNSGFSFGLNYEIMNAVKSGAPYNLPNSISIFLNRLPQGAMYANFLSNHDWFAGPRAFTWLNGVQAKCKLAASVYMTIPGIPFVYYGEEIGMGHFTKMWADYSLRTPMQWDTTPNSGFTSAAKPYRPVNTNYSEFNVATELKDPNSILSHYIKLINIRNANPLLATGEFHLVKTGNGSKYISHAVTGDKQAIIVVLNFTPDPAEIPLNFTYNKFTENGMKNGADLFNNGAKMPDITKENRASYTVNVPAYGLAMLKFDK